MNLTRVRGAAVALTLATAVTATRGQQPPTPTFRSGVDVTPIDVTVVTSSGSPIPDLKPGDFRVRVDGKDRKVLRADWIPLARPSTSPPPPPPPDGYSSNEAAATGRLIVIAIDQPNIRFDSVMDIRKAVNDFIDKVQPLDPIAAVGLGHGSASTAFTVDRAVVKRAIELMSGQSTRGNYEKGLGAFTVSVGGVDVPYVRELSMSASEAIPIYRGDSGILQNVHSRECWYMGAGGPIYLGADHAECNNDIRDAASHIAIPEIAEREQSLLGLQGLLSGLAKIDAPKTVVFVSEGFTLVDDPLSVSAIGAAAAAARTSIYAMKLDDMRMDASKNSADIAHVGDRMDRLGGLDLIASASRGTVVNIIGNGASAFAQLERELSGYYLVGVEALPSDADGKAHPINVQVSRPGAIVRSRRELAYAAGAKPSAVSPTEGVANALSQPLLDSSLPIRVATFAMREPTSGRIQVLIHADVGSGYTAGQPATIGYVIVDDKGKTLVNQIGTGRLPSAVPGVPSPLTFSGAATLDPGLYTLKLAIAEGDRVGSVEHRVHANLADAGGLKLSELMIGGPIDARLILAPTVGYDVRFGAVQGYVEAYGANARLLTMRYEVMSGPDAPPLLSADVPARAEGEDRAVFSHAMAVKDLKPGEYVLQATLSANGSVVRKVAGTFRVEPVPANPSAVAAPARAVALNVSADFLAPRFRRETMSRRDTLQRFRSTLPPGVAAAFDEGTAALVLGDDAKAEAGFRKALDSGLGGTDSTAPLAYLGATYAAGGKDLDAVGIWQAALVDGAGFPQLYEWMTDALLRLGNTDAARPLLEEAVTRWPGETGFTKPLAAIYAKNGLAREAVALLDRYLTDHPQDMPALYSGVQWMYQVHQAGLVVRSKADDVKAAGIWTDAYTLAGGPDSDTVKRWMLAIEK